MTPLEKQQEILIEFSSFSTWEERYRTLLSLGLKLPIMPVELRNDSNLIEGCHEKVWLDATCEANGTLQFYADSDSLFLRGVLNLILGVYSGSRPEEIILAPPEFIKHLGFNEGILENRASGLCAISKRVHLYATKWKVKSQLKQSHFDIGRN